MAKIMTDREPNADHRSLQHANDNPVRYTKAALRQFARLWHHGKPISAALPVRLPNGAVVANLSAGCAGCGAKHSADDIRGVIEPAVRNTGRCYLLMASLGCDSCAMITPLRYYILPESGAWGLAPAETPLTEDTVGTSTSEEPG